jgi:hypothetical protein
MTAGEAWVLASRDGLAVLSTHGDIVEGSGSLVERGVLLVDDAEMGGF